MRSPAIASLLPLWIVGRRRPEGMHEYTALAVSQMYRLEKITQGICLARSLHKV